MSLELSLSAGMLPRRTVGAPTVQGEVVTGTQGIGASVPPAAAVAVATAGFELQLVAVRLALFIKGTLGDNASFVITDVLSVQFVIFIGSLLSNRARHEVGDDVAIEHSIGILSALDDLTFFREPHRLALELPSF